MNDAAIIVAESPALCAPAPPRGPWNARGFNPYSGLWDDLGFYGMKWVQGQSKKPSEMSGLSIHILTLRVYPWYFEEQVENL
jgi:hypothetical protein